MAFKNGAVFYLNVALEYMPRTQRFTSAALFPWDGASSDQIDLQGIACPPSRYTGSQRLTGFQVVHQQLQALHAPRSEDRRVGKEGRRCQSEDVASGK